jgi:hypothetical protein
MPIILIWNQLADRQVARLGRLLSDLNLASSLLEKTLAKRLDEGRKLDDLTSSFPVFRFHDTALTAYVSRAQFGAALTRPQPGLGANIQGIADAWNFPRDWANKATEALLLPRLIALFRQIVTAAAASVKRFETPAADMFKPGAVQAVDLIGMGALLFNALAVGRHGIMARSRRAYNAVQSIPSDPAAPPGLPLDMRLDDAWRIITGALLIVPALGGLALQIGSDLIKWLRHTVLQSLYDTEQMVFDARADLLATMSRTLGAFGQTALSFLVIAQDYALGTLRYWTDFANAYLNGLFDGISAFATLFGEFWTGVQDLIGAVIGFGDAVLAISLGDVIHTTLLAIQDIGDLLIDLAYDWPFVPDGYKAPDWFAVSLGELLMGEGNGSRARSELSRGIGRLVDIVFGSTALSSGALVAADAAKVNLFGMINGLAMLMPRLNKRPLPLGAQPVLRYSVETEPDLNAAIIRPLQADLTASIGRLTDSLARETATTTTALVDMLDGTAGQFDKAGHQAARLGSTSVFERFTAGADTLADQVFPQARGGPPNPLATLGQAFGKSYGLQIGGALRGFEAIIGDYLGFAIGEWRAHLDANRDTPAEVTPTSPRILLQHARLGRVHVPQMRLKLAGWPTDQSTARRVAAEFAAAIHDAYIAGEARLAGMRPVAAAAGG